jgi:hypothetical protein
MAIFGMVCTTWRGGTSQKIYVIACNTSQKIYKRKLENLERKKIILEMILEED